MYEKHAIYQTLRNSQLFQSNTQNIKNNNYKKKFWKTVKTVFADKSSSFKENYRRWFGIKKRLAWFLTIL